MARTISMKEAVFGENATTTIPPTPIAGVAYRNTALTDTVIKGGWAYSTVVDSAGYNEILYRIAYLMNAIEKEGILEWSALTNYAVGTLTRGSTDHKIYQCLVANGPDEAAGTKNPDSGANPTYWDDYAASVSGFPVGTQGDVLYHDGSNWVVLNAGTSGQSLTTKGPGANPVWGGAVSSNPNGFTTLPNGIIIQWGTTTITGTSGGANFTFPLTFPTVAYAVSMLPSETADTGAEISYSNLTTSSVRVKIESAADETHTLSIIAIGA